MAREMKDSGIAWIGEIPAEWKVMPIKRVAQILRGGSPRPIEQYMSLNDEGYNWIRIGDSKKGSKYIDSTLRKIIPKGLSKTRLITKGSLILSNSMSFGQPYILEIDGCIHDGWVAFSDLSVEKEFLYYYLLSDFAHTQFEQQVSGGVVLNLNIDKIGTSQIFIPDKIEQRRIAAYLDNKCAHIDAVIEKTRASIDEYKKLKQAIITRAVTKGLHQGRKMKDSGIEWIGEIPQEWKVHLLKYSIRWKSEKSHGNDEVLSLYRDYGVIPKNSRADNHNVTSLDTSNYKYVEVGDLVINKMKAWQGSIAVSTYQGIVSPAYHVCKITDKRIYQKYLHYLLRNALYYPEYRRLSTGMRIGQWDLGFDDFKNLPFLLPPLSEQQEIAAYLDAKTAAIDRLIAKKEQLVAEMQSCKKSLIYEVVTGKKEVPN